MVGRDDDDPLFLQLKSVEASVLEPFLGKNQYANHGQRVGEGQWLMQAASDIMLGRYRVTGIDDLKRDFYFRQLSDEKGSALIEGMKPREVDAYAEICGRTLARAQRALRGCWHDQRLPRLKRGGTRWPTSPSLRRSERNGPRHAERRRHDRARQSAHVAVVRISVSIPIIRFG